jgi:hypothetical protein
LVFGFYFGVAERNAREKIKTQLASLTAGILPAILKIKERVFRPVLIF